MDEPRCPMTPPETVMEARTYIVPAKTQEPIPEPQAPTEDEDKEE